MYGVAGLAMLGTAVFYKLAVQTGELTELGNDFDWALIALLSGALVAAPTLARAASHGGRGRTHP